MKLVSISNIGAIALTGLAFTLATSTLSAHESKGGSKGSSKGSRCAPSRGSHCSSRGHGSRTCSHLPRGCRPSHYRGERCWYGGGNYYRCNTVGTYEIIDQPEVEYQTSYVSQPTYVEQAVEEDDSAEETVSYLPESCSTVYIGGERCYYNNGCYYRHCGRGYTKFHCKDHGRGGRTCRNDRGHNPSHGTKCSNKNASKYHTKGSSNARSMSHNSGGHGHSHK